MPPKKDFMNARSSRIASTSSAPKMSTNAEGASQPTEEDEGQTDDSSDYDGGVVIQGFSPCGKTKKHKFICSGGVKDCGTKISSGEDSVMCNMCWQWFHPKCQGLSTEAFRALSRFSRLYMVMHGMQAQLGLY